MSLHFPIACAPIRVVANLNVPFNVTSVNEISGANNVVSPKYRRILLYQHVCNTLYCWLPMMNS